MVNLSKKYKLDTILEYNLNSKYSKLLKLYIKIRLFRIS